MLTIVLPCSGPISSRGREAAEEPSRPETAIRAETTCTQHARWNRPGDLQPTEIPRRQPGPLREGKEGRWQQMSDKKIASTPPSNRSPSAQHSPAASTSSAGREKALGRQNRTISAQATLVCRKMDQYTCEGGDAEKVLPPKGARCCLLRAAHPGFRA
jgi:hypothetical protein